MYTSKTKPQWYIAIKSFIKLAGKFNVRISTIKNYLLKLQGNIINESEEISELLNEIQKKLSKKACSKRTFVNIPQWERFIKKCNAVLKDFRRKSHCIFIDVEPDVLDGTIVKINKNIHLYVEDMPCKHKGKHFHIRHPDFRVVFSMKDLTQPWIGDIPVSYRKHIYDWIEQNKDFLIRKVDEEFEKRKKNALPKREKKRKKK